MSFCNSIFPLHDDNNGNIESRFAPRAAKQALKLLRGIYHERET